MNEKENLAKLRGLYLLRQNFLNSLKKPKLKATRSKWYWIHLLPYISGINKEKTLSKACLKMILQSFCNLYQKYCLFKKIYACLYLLF